MHRLTERQRSIAIAIVDGMSNKAIARQLACSQHTVRDHVSAMLRKLGVGNRAQLAAAVARALDRQHSSPPAAARRRPATVGPTDVGPLHP